MRKRIEYIDLIKTIAILMVVGTHVPLFEYDFINGNISNIIQYVLKMLSNGVTLFIIVNGFLLFSREELDIRKHYKKTIKTFVLVLIWAVILIIVNLLFDKTALNRSLFVDLFLEIGSGLYVKELWYLVDLIAIYFIYPVLWFSFRNNKPIFYHFLVIMGIFVFGGELIKNISYFASTQIRSDLIIKLYEEIRRFDIFSSEEYMLFYFCFGAFIYDYKDELSRNHRKLLIMGVISAVLEFTFAYYSSVSTKVLFNPVEINRTIFALPIVMSVFSYVDNYTIPKTISSIIFFVSSNTLGIYVTHSFFIRLFRLVMAQNSIILRLLITVLSFMSSLLFTTICKKIPIVKRLFSL